MGRTATRLSFLNGILLNWSFECAGGGGGIAWVRRGFFRVGERRGERGGSFGGGGEDRVGCVPVKGEIRSRWQGGRKDVETETSW